MRSDWSASPVQPGEDLTVLHFGKLLQMRSGPRNRSQQHEECDHRDQQRREAQTGCRREKGLCRNF